MLPRYWVVSREVIRRGIERDGMLYLNSQSIIASDYDTQRQHIRCVVYLVGALVCIECWAVKRFVENNFTEDVAVLNVTYMGCGEYAINLDIKLMPYPAGYVFLSAHQR